MDFREFATNYLNPVFIFYRATLLIASFFIWFLSMPMFIRDASRVDMLMAIIMSLALTIGLYIAFRRRAYLLYLIIPFILVVTAVSIRGNEIVQEGVLKAPLVMCWVSALLLAFNGFRSWGYGISANEINNKIQNKLDNFK